MSDDGWVPVTDTWAYASADAPTFTFTVQGDHTAEYSVGSRVKLTQTTARYFIVTAVAFAAGTTTVTVYGGTDATLDNATITAPSYSRAKAPLGFPLDPAKWTVAVADATNATQASPTQEVWYNLGGISITMPIGVWDVHYTAPLESWGAATAVAVNARCTLSTSASAESDNELTGFLRVVAALYGTVGNIGGASLSQRKTLTATEKTVYYLLAKAHVPAQSLSFRGDIAKTRIDLVCAYL